MRLLIENPAITFRDCEQCQIFHYNEETGKPYERRDGQPAKRHWGCPPPCRTQVGCPKGTPENSKALSPKNLQAYEHYRECKAVGQFPEDSIIRRNAAIIAMFEKLEERKYQIEFMKGIVGG